MRDSDAFDETGLDAARTGFHWSYAALPAESAKLLALLGLFPSATFSLDAAAALAGVPAGRARRALNSLTSASLVELYPRNRYRLHDVTREYAEEMAGETMSEDERGDAERRLLTWYLLTRMGVGDDHRNSCFASFAACSSGVTG